MGPHRMWGNSDQETLNQDSAVFSFCWSSVTVLPCVSWKCRLPHIWDRSIPSPTLFIFQFLIGQVYLLHTDLEWKGSWTKMFKKHPVLGFCEHTSVSQLSRQNVGALMPHNPMGLHGLVQG
jgi:hypothetical protein